MTSVFQWIQLLIPFIIELVKILKGVSVPVTGEPMPRKTQRAVKKQQRKEALGAALGAVKDHCTGAGCPVETKSN